MRELRHALEGLAIELLTRDDYPGGLPDVEEDGAVEGHHQLVADALGEEARLLLRQSVEFPHGDPAVVIQVPGQRFLLGRVAIHAGRVSDR